MDASGRGETNAGRVLILTRRWGGAKGREKQERQDGVGDVEQSVSESGERQTTGIKDRRNVILISPSTRPISKCGQKTVEDSGNASTSARRWYPHGGSRG